MYWRPGNLKDDSYSVVKERVGKLEKELECALRGLI